MSPHAVPVPSVDDANELQEQFSVTCNAFLPEDSPSEILSDSYYSPWEAIASNLPQLIDNGCIRSEVAQMPLLSTDRLATDADWRRAYVLLGFMTHAYVWGGATPEEILPPQITVPFLRVSSRLELPPVLTYAAANLWNFKSTSDDFTDLSSLDTLVSFTGTESEAWFLLISVAMEARGADIIQTMVHALHAVKSRNYKVITDALQKLAICIDGVGTLLDRMYEKCDPTTFYYRIRPFLAGSKNMAAAGLPRGVFYDEGDGKGEWRELRGGSNGQSSLIQFFDVVLGVDHRGNGADPTKCDVQSDKEEKSFHAQVREYMPGPHARFLQHVARMGSIRELALLPPQTEQQIRLRAAYTTATDSLAEFRNKHIRIVTRYIVIPSKQSHDPTHSARKNLATSSDALKKDEELTGTGGTALMPFLKQTRDETKRAGDLN
jgi:indoleamine 2,3-dioxygenase